LNRQNAEKIITEYLKPIYGFARKRCNNMQDVEDLSHDIVLKAFKAFLIKDDIADPGKLIWTIAHNALSKHLRKIEEYELQFVFYSDGWFLLHYIKALLDNGKLKLPTKNQRKALTTLLIHK
jgi:DNA-directed RNA polymerase specialized sigma24 family protein